MKLRNIGSLALSAGCMLGAVAPAGSAAAQRRTPAIRHVFVIVLENQSYETTFGPGTRAPYLADSLTSKGAFLRQYYGIGHSSLDNYVAMISGIAPNPSTQADCGRFVEFVQTGTSADGQPVGKGCVYPATVLTIANQLKARRLSWKAYMEDMGNDPARETATCAHATIGELDPTERATANDQYAAKHNPFVYFHAVADAPSCRKNVVPLTAFEADLASVATTPNYAFISPNLCHDGHDSPCKDGEAGGLVSANEFLAHWIPIIQKSRAYRDDGLIIVTFDESGSADASACCNERSGPNTPAPGTHGPGGGRTGAVLLSRYIRGGTVTDVPYNHYSMLRSVEDIFGLAHLGYAGAAGLVPFGRDVYSSR